MSMPYLLSERMKGVLCSGDGSDVHFLVGQGEAKELLSAHKFVLKLNSDVFEAMFRFDSQNEKTKTHGTNSANSGHKMDELTEQMKKLEINGIDTAEEHFLIGKENDDKKEMHIPIVVDDIEADVFKVMLNFIYSEDLSGLNGDNLVEVFYAAQKYNIRWLVKVISNWDISKLPNVFRTLVQAKFIGEEKFSARCSEYIDRHADELIQSEQFLEIDQELLTEILGRDNLQIKEEIQIWHSAIRWADSQCNKIAIECSAENRRAMLGPALFKIRFPLISEKNIFEQIVPSGVLTGDEMAGIYLYNSNPNRCVSKLYPLHFPTQKRVPYENPKGTFFMKIENFFEFARENDGSRRYSDTVLIRGRPWKIMATNEDEEWLRLYIECADENFGLKWKYPFSATLRIASKKEGKREYVIKKSGEMSFNWSNYITSILFLYLMSPENGWYNAENDSVILTVEVITGEPHK